MNYQTFAGMISSGIALGALTYQAGRHNETIESLGVRVSQAEHRGRDHDNLLFEVHGKICSMQKDIKHLLDKVNDKWDP